MSNFIIYSTKEDYYKIIYRDIIGKDNVRFIVSPVEGRNFFLRLLYKVMMSPKLDILFRGFRKFLNPLYDRKFCNKGRNVYVFFYGRLPWIDYGLLDYIKNKHPDCLTVCYFQDLIAKKNIDINKVKSQFDLLLDYDEEESQKFDLVYAPTPFSFVSQNVSSEQTTDVYFVGQAKERLADIYRMFDLLSSAGFKCDFYIAGVREENRRNQQGFHFIEKHLPYLENLRKVSQCKIVLELMQKGAVGYTLRTWEAIAYNKILLTNNTSLETSSLIDEYNILTFDKIDENTIEKLRNYKKKNYTYKSEFSPTKLLNKIDEYGK